MRTRAALQIGERGNCLVDNKIERPGISMERRNSASERRRQNGVEQRRCVTELKLEPVSEQVPSGTSRFANRLGIELTSSGAELNKRELQRQRGNLVTNRLASSRNRLDPR